ncbi:hypothetical protein JMN32_15655 [Fulvivirga sp. 29W222]|uniref:Uncharacterized protein n=1 Tax=Fulvivirga marina TaxID=2494733 RepID=A0A937KCU0_9BACT|nr:hypothetical protein [Fulvivirga marina]MBL6447754.1 hypothetical protein [Fulvivirga marina]
MMKRRTLTLLVVGLFVFAMAQVIGHYAGLADFEYGILMGVGIGLMTLSLIKGRLMTNR